MSDSISRACSVQQDYRNKNVNDGDEVEMAVDIIADQLRAVPEEGWAEVLRRAVIHAHEEIHGWGTAESLSLWVEGLSDELEEAI
ncbi:hypothetical protein ABT340_15700 [Streptosporangium sp. NPDC000239]|uniref:hypothetical protein n=1 Tax=Streptosporangium sp. NPDC000239 TaxID=3154248 RepID=UPI003328BB2C